MGMEDLLGSYNNGQGDFFMRKKWKYYIDRMLTFALIGILLPLFITIICQRMRLEEVIYGTYDAITETAEREGGEELEEQLPFILAKEIRADAEDAALMAQCGIARTTLYDAAARGEEQPAAFSEEELRQALGETCLLYTSWDERDRADHCGRKRSSVWTGRKGLVFPI